MLDSEQPKRSVLDRGAPSYSTWKGEEDVFSDETSEADMALPRPVRRRVSRRGSSVDGGRYVHAVEIGPIDGEAELLLSRPPRSPSRRRSRRQADVIQDPARDALVLDDADQLHAFTTPRARQDVEIRGAAHQRGPREPSLALGIIGTAGTVYVSQSGCNRLPSELT
jgi:hypothetical protein